MSINRLKEILKVKHFNKLMQFMQGQTMDASGIYEDDFMRWFYHQDILD